MRLSIHEVLELVTKESNTDAKVNILRKNSTPTLKMILKMNFDPSVEFDLPSGAPPYKTDKNIPEGFSDANLYSESRRLYLFLTTKELPKAKKEMMFIQMLEGLHRTEAELLIALKDKKLYPKYKGLTERVVRIAFPDLLPAEEPEKEKNVSSEVEVEVKAVKPRKTKTTKKESLDTSETEVSQSDPT